MEQNKLVCKSHNGNTYTLGYANYSNKQPIETELVSIKDDTTCVSPKPQTDDTTSLESLFFE